MHRLLGKFFWPHTMAFFLRETNLFNTGKIALPPKHPYNFLMVTHFEAVFLVK